MTSCGLQLFDEIRQVAALSRGHSWADHGPGPGPEGLWLNLVDEEAAIESTEGQLNARKAIPRDTWETVRYWSHADVDTTTKLLKYISQ